MRHRGDVEPGTRHRPVADPDAPIVTVMAPFTKDKGTGPQADADWGNLPYLVILMNSLSSSSVRKASGPRNATTAERGVKCHTSRYPAQNTRDGLGVPFVTDRLMTHGLQLLADRPEAAPFFAEVPDQRYGLLLFLVLQEGFPVRREPPPVGYMAGTLVL